MTDPGVPNFIAIIEMVDFRIIEIDGLLDAAQAELLGEEIAVLLGMGGHRGHVVQALDLCKHDDFSFRLRDAHVSVGHKMVQTLKKQNSNNIDNIIAIYVIIIDERF